MFNTALLTGSSLIMSLIGMSFQVWLARRIGKSGIGLYQLMISVSMLCTCFAVSGIRFAATRLISEELGSNREGTVKSAMLRCFGYSAFFGLAAFTILYFIAEPVGFLWLGDARCVKSLRIMAYAMPFIAFSSVISGYFTACGRVWKPTLVHFIEQLISIALVALFLSRTPAGDIEKNCAAVMLGTVCGDVISFALMFGLYLSDISCYVNLKCKVNLTSRMLRVALPLAFSAYARSSLSTLEHMLVPRGLKASGMSSDEALSGYGVIQGMVMPIVSFPACLLIALSELIVPELTEAQMRGDEDKIKRTVIRLIKKGLGYSFAAALLIFTFSDKLGMSIYRSAEAAQYLRLLAPLIPVMYTDILIDGCLKGLGQQMWNMGINILDSLLGVVLVWTMLPKGALSAYIWIIYFNECLNFVLSALRLSSVTGIKVFPREPETAKQM